MDMSNHLAHAFKEVFKHISHDGIKKGVTEKGLDRFINECALLAAGTGVASGLGGAITMIVGVPADVINNVVQQFRVTLAVIYHRKEKYSEIEFNEFMAIVGMSLGVEVGATLTKAVMISIANAALARMSASVAGKLVPLLGAVIGGSANFMFVKGIGKAVQALDL